MKIWKAVLLTACALAAPAQTVRAAADFEGQVDFKVTNEKKEAHAFKYLIKGNKARIEWDAKDKNRGAGAMIMDDGRKVMTMLMPEQQQYMEMPMKDAEEAAAEYQKNDKRSFEKTGRTETILGYPAEQYIAKDEDGQTEIWATKQLGYFGGFRSGDRKVYADWQKKLMKEGFFPLKVFERTAAGKDKSSWEVTKIEKKALAKDLFAPPATFTKIEMPQMPAGMKDFKGMFKKGMTGGREN